MSKTDFKLFKVSYIHPLTGKVMDCGEMRGWHADKFVQECDQHGLVSIVERRADDQSLSDFVLNLCEQD